MNFEFFIKIVIVIVALFIWLIGGAVKKAKKEQEKLAKNKDLNIPPGNLDAGQEYSLFDLQKVISADYFEEKPLPKKETQASASKITSTDYSYSSPPASHTPSDAEEGVLFELTSENILSAIIMKEILEPRGGKRSF